MFIGTTKESFKKKERERSTSSDDYYKNLPFEINLSINFYYVIDLVTKSALDSQEVILKCTAQKEKKNKRKRRLLSPTE